MKFINIFLYIFTLILSILIFFFVTQPENRLIHHDNYSISFDHKDFPKSFDFIIIGAGSAGSVLAKRLTSNGKYNVLLLEAGGSDNDLLIKIPSAYSKNFNTKNDWAYDSIPQVNKGNYTVFLPRGKVIGGSSSVNAMIYIRGSAYDYDNWSKYNITGWDYDTMLKYFKKSEKQINQKLSKDYHGFDGEWVIGDVKRNEITETIVEAYNKELGLPLKDDFNSDRYQEEGIGFNQVNIKDGERWSLSDAFLNKDVLKRKNLYIKINAHVSKIIFEDKTAVGVEILYHGKKIIVKADKEVILSAGAYNTPHILQLSGIGDKNLLQKHKIDVILDNPEVGKNMQDHPTFGFVQTSKEEVTMDKYDRFPHSLIKLIEWFYKREESPLTTNVCEVNGFMKSPQAKANKENAPDMQIIAAAGTYVDHGRKKFDIPGGISIGFVLLNPESRGTVKITSNNPLDHPEIDPNMFGEEIDLNRMLSMIEPLKKINTYHKLRKYVSGSLLADINDPIEKIKQALDEHSFLLYHPCCTAAMGKVVDSELKVIGIKRLRVIDASIMPEITRGNTNAPTVAIAEKASDMILQNYTD